MKFAVHFAVIKSLNFFRRLHKLERLALKKEIFFCIYQEPDDFSSKFHMALKSVDEICIANNLSRAADAAC